MRLLFLVHLTFYCSAIIACNKCLSPSSSLCEWTACEMDSLNWTELTNSPALQMFNLYSSVVHHNHHLLLILLHWIRSQAALHRVNNNCDQTNLLLLGSWSHSWVSLSPSLSPCPWSPFAEQRLNCHYWTNFTFIWNSISRQFNSPPRNNPEEQSSSSHSPLTGLPSCNALNWNLSCRSLARIVFFFTSILWMWGEITEICDRSVILRMIMIAIACFRLINEGKSMSWLQTIICALMRCSSSLELDTTTSRDWRLLVHHLGMTELSDRPTGCLISSVKQQQLCVDLSTDSDPHSPFMSSIIRGQEEQQQQR